MEPIDKEFIHKMIKVTIKGETTKASLKHADTSFREKDEK